MATVNRALDNEFRIRELTEKWMKALCAKDVDAMLTHYAPDVVFFDVKPPLRGKGVAAYRKMWEDCLPYMQGPVDYQIHEQTIVAGEEVAYSHSLNRMRVNSTSGRQIDFFLRATVCFQKIDGEWLVTHEHASAPFDPTTMQARMDLKP